VKVRLTTDRAGGWGFQFDGEVIEVTEEEGRRLIAAQQAEAIDELETATAAAPAENAMKPRRLRSKP
jgi:hypothetical protein